MSFHLQVGEVVVENPAAATNYVTTGHPSFPEPEPDGYGGHKPAERTFTVWCTGATSSAAHASAAALRRECLRDKSLYFRHGDTGDVLETRIRDARVTETEYNPTFRDAFGVKLEVKLTTDPYWMGPWSTLAYLDTVSQVPGHYDITGVTGEVDALLSLRMVPTVTPTFLAVGIKPDPLDGYDYLDDYSGTSDTNAVGDAKATLSASATGQEIGTAPIIDTNDNRGRHLVIARVDSTATAAASSSVKTRVAVTGYNISSSSTVDSGYYPFTTATDLHGLELGTVQIPAAQIPTGEYESGYAAESVGAQNTTASTWFAWGYGAVSATSVWQSFPVSARCLSTGVTFKIKNTNGYEWFPQATLYTHLGDCLFDTLLAASDYPSVPASSSATVRFTWESPILLRPETYVVLLEYVTVSGLYAYYSTASSYSSGKMNWGVASPSADLYFQHHVRLPLGFDSVVALWGTCSSASKTLGLDYSERIPVDYAAVVYRDITTGSALYYDGDTDTPYCADADGIGAAVLDKAEVRRPLRLKPGVTNRLVFAMFQSDSEPGGLNATYSTYQWRPRFLTATG